MNDNEEQWKLVIGWEDRYEVSSIGNVRSLAMEVNGVDSRPKCSGGSQDLHHLRGRGLYLCSPEYFCASFRPGHDWIGDHKNEARTLGLLLT